MAKRKRKRITKELVRAAFGDDAEISWLYPWRVKTLTGGEVVISQRQMKTIYGTEDTHRAIMLLAGECWGKAVSRGSNEFILAQVMHGQAADIPVRADYGNRHAGLVRLLVFCFILFLGCMMGAAQSGAVLLLTLLVAVVIVAAMAQSAKREKEKKHEAMGFPYPRIYGSAGPARREDLKRREWL